MSETPAPIQVLLIEDLKSDMILIEKALKQAAPDKFCVTREESLAAAMRRLADSHYDVALLDLTLPDAAGLMGLLNLQNMMPKLPIVILTANEDEEQALEAVELGAQDYLLKSKATGDQMVRAMQFAVQRKSFEQALINRANFDTLTGLANRALFESRLDMALARSRRMGGGVGVFFLDLDRFKHVNDTFGHAAGDFLLQEIAKRLTQSIRAYDTAARFGGDEFALLIEGLHNPEDCVIIAEKIVRLVTMPVRVGHRPVEIGVSIGIATCMDSQAFDRETLMQQADAAMYEVKRAPKANYCFYGLEASSSLISKQ